MATVNGAVGKPQHISEMIESTKMNGNQAQDAAGRVDTPVSSDTPDYLHVFDSRTCNIHHIPVSDGFVRGSDLSTIAAPVKGNSGRMQKLAVLDPGFQHTACKESGITFMYAITWGGGNCDDRLTILVAMEKRENCDTVACASKTYFMIMTLTRPYISYCGAAFPPRRRKSHSSAGYLRQLPHHKRYAMSSASYRKCYNLLNMVFRVLTAL
jgi:hypothetical protein